MPINPVVLPKSQLNPLEGSTKNKNLTLLDIQLHSCPMEHREKYHPILVSLEERGIAFPRRESKHSVSAPSRQPYLLLLRSQSHVQEERSELLFACERGPRRGDGNITPGLYLLCLNQSLGDVSLPTCVKDPDTLIPLFFFLPVWQSTLLPHACSLNGGFFIYNSWFVYLFIYFLTEEFIQTRIIWIVADSLLHTQSRTRGSQQPQHASINFT